MDDPLIARNMAKRTNPTDDPLWKMLAGELGASEVRELQAYLAGEVDHWLLVDLPGYGYAKLSKSISSEWPKFIEPYLAERPTLALCLCLVDSNIPPQKSDTQLIHFLKSYGRRILVVGTKADRLSGNARVKAQAELRKGLEVEDLLLCSSKTGAGLKEVWSAIYTAAEDEV